MRNADAPWRGSALAAASALTAAVLASPPADAYCRTSVCNGSVVGKICEPAEADDCGLPLYWSKRCVGFSVQQDASDRVPWEVADTITTEAFDTWHQAPCEGGEGPSIEGIDLGPVECSVREYNQSGGNANVVVFRDEGWPYAGQWNTLALTTVTYNLDTGEIYDADLEINSDDVALTWDDAAVQYDLPSIVVHEVGHVLGLAHTSVPDATMYSDYQPGTSTLRDLESDDIAGICAVYPPGPPRSDLPCDPTPRHGFKSDCGPGAEEPEGCSVQAPAPASGRHLGLLAAVWLGAWLARRRSSSRRARARREG